MESLKDNLDGSQARAYHSIYFVNGTECDITHQPRTTKVEVQKIYTYTVRLHT